MPQAPGTEGKTAVLLSAVRGLGSVAKYTAVGPELNATQWVTHVLRTEEDREASLATLECIRDMSVSSPTTHGVAFSDLGTVELVAWKMSSLPTDVVVQAAGMQALNAMAGGSAGKTFLIYIKLSSFFVPYT